MAVYMLSRVTRWFCALLLLSQVGLLQARLAVTPQGTRRDLLSMNNCEGYAMKFPDSRRIFVDRYCNEKRTAYSVEGSGDAMVDGIYEQYGRTGGADRFERVLGNGTTFILGRIQEHSNTWAIVRSDRVLYMAAGRPLPPENGWTAVAGPEPAPRVARLSFPEVKLKIRRNNINLRDSNTEQCEVAVGEEGEGSCDGGESKLLQMLHPAVGPQLGDSLHSRYGSAYPVPSITLDGLLEPKALSQSLSFLDVPLSSWIGPEEAIYCCEKKYRLNFTKWPRRNGYVTGVQQLLSSHTFIGFLERMTGIEGLVPMTADDERMLWAGSSLIAISPGGYLHVHNDVSEREAWHGTR